MARKRAMRQATSRLPGLRPVGRPTGTLARRRQVRASMVVALVVAANVVVWVLRPDWGARLGVLVVSLLVAPVLVALSRPRP